MNVYEVFCLHCSYNSILRTEKRILFLMFFSFVFLFKVITRLEYKKKKKQNCLKKEEIETSNSEQQQMYTYACNECRRFTSNVSHKIQATV